ncbi:hypothetical protein PENSPDRAFT_670441 [Peniophora sp. CONT]|nr:hypothetical protein PENSPDRAFT_670441 [Peniophora sp. CONT]
MISRMLQNVLLIMREIIYFPYEILHSRVSIHIQVERAARHEGQIVIPPLLPRESTFLLIMMAVNVVWASMLVELAREQRMEIADMTARALDAMVRGADNTRSGLNGSLKALSSECTCNFMVWGTGARIKAVNHLQKGGRELLVGSAERCEPIRIRLEAKRLWITRAGWNRPDLFAYNSEVTRTRMDSAPISRKVLTMDAIQKERSEVYRVLASSNEDTRMHTQILDKLQGVNYIVFQAAHAMVDKLSPTHSLDAMPDHLAVAQFDAVVPGMGPVLTDRDASEDKKIALITIYIQSALCKVCHGFIGQCGVAQEASAGGRDMETFMGALNESTLTKEPIAITGNWKALTHMHLHAMSLQTLDQQQSRLLDELRASLLPVWSAFGLNEEQIRVTSGDPEVSAHLQDLVAEVGAFVQDVSQVVSAEYELVSVIPGTELDVAAMKVVYDGPEASTIPKVVCTAGLGLQRRTRTTTGEVATSNVASVEIVSDLFWGLSFT